MNINYLKDVLFDLLNECDALDLSDIESRDSENLFILHMADGSQFRISVDQM